MNMSNKFQCKKCKYEWIPRVLQPKECPECKARLNRQITLEGK